ncbi:SGNH/GDSL hydrolase family protein [Actinomadura fulvescens]|uniref:SGNH/GDSL hydrolase family protein n=1 Tax=Actinomadura fulvescens TaxID=46160 RepID=A0ABN3PD08_9ACTN
MGARRRAVLGGGVCLAASLAVTGVAIGSGEQRGQAVRSGAAVRWTATWSASMGGATAKPVSASSYTLRDVVRVSAGGSAVRIRLSNFYARQNAVIGRVMVAPARQGAPAGRFVPVTFNGRRQVTIPAGKHAASDAVRLRVGAGADLIVDTHVRKSPAKVSFHATGKATTRVARGDHAGAKAAGAFTVSKTSRYFLTGVDVSGSRRVVVAFGDSITDGSGSTTDRDRRYPDRLAARLRGRLAVTNAGIAGNRMLDDQVSRGAGLAGVRRFTSHALDQQPGVRTVILLQGGNDITGRTPPRTAAEMVAGYRKMVAAAHKRGIRVLGGTITPRTGASGHTAAKERVRAEVNRRIRAGGVFDGVIDFDAALRDPARPARLRAAYDSGDHRHPNDRGYAAMAAAVNLGLL